MSNLIEHKLVPFDIEMGSPQKQIFLYEKRIIQSIWMTNTKDNTLTLRLNDLSNYKTLIITKVVPKSFIPLRDRNGIFVFALFVYSSSVDNPLVWIINRNALDNLGDV